MIANSRSLIAIAFFLVLNKNQRNLVKKLFADVIIVALGWT